MCCERGDLMNHKYLTLLAYLLISGCSTNVALKSAPIEGISIVNFTIPSELIFVDDYEKNIKNGEELLSIYYMEEEPSNNEEIETQKIKKPLLLQKEENKPQIINDVTKKEKQTIASTSKTEISSSKPKETKTTKTETKTTKTETKPKNPDHNKTEATNPEIETKEDSIVTTNDSCQGSGFVFQGNEACTNSLNTSYGEIVNFYPGTNKGFDDARTWAMDKFNTDYNGKYLDTYNIDYVEFTDGNFYYVVQFTYIDLEA